MQNDDLERQLRILERSLDLSDGFLLQLYSESTDSTFVLKAHALIETASANLLEHALGYVKLRSTLEHLPLGGRAGKLAFLQDLGLVEKHVVAFCNVLSELRNAIAHNVHRMRFSFADAHVAWNPSAWKSLRKVAIGLGGPTARTRHQEDFAQRPRHTLWLNTIYAFATMQLQTERAKENQTRIRRALKELTD